MHYEPIFKALHQHQVRYLVVGGLAMNLHGVPRMTIDIDIVLSTDKSNLLKLIIALKSIDYRPRLPIPAEDLLDEEKRNSWIRDKNLISFSFISDSYPASVVDVVLKHPLDFEEAYISRSDISLEDYTISLISIDNLQRMKCDTDRQQDAADIEMLERIKNEQQ